MADIQIDPKHSVVDERLVDLYSKHMIGLVPIAYTRLPASSITSGFYKRECSTAILFSRVDPDAVGIFVHRIRAGWRPTIDVYWSGIAPNGGAYVCPDDEVSLAAYNKLDFALVPSRVLRPKKIDATEGSIWVRAESERIFLDRVVAPTSGTYASLIGREMPDILTLIKKLMEECSNTLTRIEDFHQEMPIGVHYHEMLSAAVRRHRSSLKSINHMIENGNVDHAEALTRMAYEAFLNFYVDWLSPEFFGPRMQLLSAIRHDSARGRNALQSSLPLLTNFPAFLENTSEKARVSPLGLAFHKSIYPSLSLVTHQSYGNLERELSESYPYDGEESDFRAKQLGRWLDFLTAALLVRIGNDIGLNMPKK